MAALSLKSLPLDEADLAFPLLRMMRPDVSLASWRQYVARCATDAPEAGITVLTDETGIIQGMFTWVVRTHLGTGRTLVTEEFGFVYAADPRPAAERLLRRIDELARERHCQAIRIGIPHELQRALNQRGSELDELLDVDGYRPEGTRYIRRLEAPAELTSL